MKDLLNRLSMLIERIEIRIETQIKNRNNPLVLEQVLEVIKEQEEILQNEI